MAVRIRMKKLGRRHRPFFRVCAMDSRSPRDGKVIEELGYYDPMVKETDARAVLNGERVAYWLSVGAQPSENVKTLIKKYGKDGTHLHEQQQALERLAANKPIAPPPVAVPAPKSKEEAQPEQAAAEESSEATEAAAEPAAEAEAAESAEAANEAKSEEENSEESKPEESKEGGE